MTDLTGKKIAILATDGFEESELIEPKKALEDSGAEVFIISTGAGKIKAWKHGNWSIEIKVDIKVQDADEQDYDALVIPGGEIGRAHV